MKVSVIVPVFNQQCYVRECLQSICAQTYSDIEIIVIDDGSTDCTPEICDEMATHDSRIRVIHQANQGPSVTRNHGVEIAQGEYTMFVDGDDTLHPRAIDTLLRLLTDNASSIAIGQMSADERTLTDTGLIRVRDKMQAIEDTLYQRDIDSSLCCKLMPTEILKSTPQPIGQRYEDLSTFYKIYEKVTSTIVSTSANLYYYRPNQHSFIHIFSPDRLDVVKVTDEIESHYAKDDKMLPAARDRKFSAYFNMYVLSKRSGMHDVSDRLWQVIKDYRKSEIVNPNVRLKNKIGALISYLGQGTVMMLSKLIY